MLPAETLSVQFFEAAAHFGDQIAFQIKRKGRYVRVSYREVAEQVHRLATFLRRLRIGPGDRVALLAENRPEWCVAYLGIVAAGGTAVPLDAQLGRPELEILLRHSESRAIVVSETELAKVHPPIASLPLPLEVVLLDEEAPPEAHTLHAILQNTPKEPLPSVPAEAIASILYTSGTTGRPKGVILTHRNFVSNCAAVRTLKVCGPDDNLLALLPLHHVYPFMVTFLVPLLSGSRVTFLQSLKAPDLLECMRETGVTVLVGVPQLLALLRRGILQEVEKRPRPLPSLFDLLLAVAGAARTYLTKNLGRLLFPQIHRRFGGRLRVLTSGGAKLDPAVGRDLYRLGFSLLEGYGLTETSPVVTFTSPEEPRFDSVGVPLPGVHVRIVDPDADGVGEIAIQGPNVMGGYFKDPEETAQSFRNGWFLSGDLGYLDAEGFLHITGRRKEVIVLPTGKTIYPEEVEAHFLTSPFIKEICLLGDETGDLRTEGLTALVVPNFDHLRAQRIANAEDMVRWEMETLSRALPAYKRPTRLRIVKDPFPRTRLGKIQRYLVRQMLLQGEAPAAEGDEGLPPSQMDQALWESPVTRKILAALPDLSRKKQGIRLDDNLELDLGLDSLSRIELLVSLEEIFGIDLPPESGPELFTVRDVVLKVHEHLGERSAAVKAEQEIPRPSWSDILAGEPPEPVRTEIAAGQEPWALIVSFLSHRLLRLLFGLFCRFRVHGLHHVPDRGPYLITPNHASYIDAFAVGAALPFRMIRHLHFLGFQQFFHTPVTAMFGRAYRVIQVDTEAYLFQALRAAAHVLRQGEILCIFPEGARSIDGEIKPFKKGGAILAKEMNLPMLPVRILGSFEIWSRDRRYPRPHPLTVIFGPPVTVKELLAQEAIPPGADLYGVISARLRDRVAALSP
jgi:long-chain acyl-CoA synthetase